MNTHEHHTHAFEGYGRAFAIGIALNSAFILAEVIYGLKADSLALLADAGHNASDVLGLLLAWGAIILGKQAANARYTYGLQGASILAALANGLLLLVAVGGIGWEALQRFSEPANPATGIMMAVAAIGVVVNGITAWLFFGHGGDLNIRGAFLHMAADAGISLGVVVAGAVILWTGWLWIDPLVSLLVIAVIVAGTWRLLKDSTALALHAVPTGINASAVQAHLAALPGVAEVHDLHIWAMSTTDTAMSVHLVMPNGHPGDGFIAGVAEEMKDRFHIRHSTFQIELGDGGGCHSSCEPVT